MERTTFPGLAQRPLSAFGLGAILVIFAVFDIALLRLFTPGTDWAPLWVAGKLAWTDAASAYDFVHVTQLQVPLIAPTGERPFVYPPTSLLLFAPLALLPFRISLIAAVAASLLLLVRASKHIGANLLVLVAAPPVVLAAIAGQPTLLVTGLVLSALLLLDRNERLAGLLLGLAAVLKPPLLLLAPFALLGGRNWRALEAAAATIAAAVVVTLGLFGLEPWKNWLAALPHFQDLVLGSGPLLRNTVTPYATAFRLGFDPSWTGLALAFVVVPIVVATFARSRQVAVRLIALLGGALLITPYGMYYELAALAPAVAATPLRRPADALIPVTWALCLFLNASVIGLLTVYVWTVSRLYFRSRADNRAVDVRVNVAA